MSRFYGSFSSDSTQDSTKRGHSFVSAHVRGWRIGVQTYVQECEVCGADKVMAYETAGSNGAGCSTLIYEKCAADCQK